MKLTLVTVTKPENRLELQACAVALRDNEKGPPNDWLIITERANVREVENIIPFENVIAMEDLAPETALIEDGWLRQQVAKCAAVKAVEHDGFIVFLDDDVMTEKPWDPETFLDANGMVKLYFRPTAAHHFLAGTVIIYGNLVSRQYLIGLPHAQTVSSLTGFLRSVYYERALLRWKAGIRYISEFELMGEFAWREEINSHGFRNQKTARDHWTADLGIFRDWQGGRRELRRQLELAIIPREPNS